MGLIVRHWLAWMGGAAVAVVASLLVVHGWMVSVFGAPATVALSFCYGFMIGLPAGIVGVQRGLRAEEKRQRSNGAPVA